MKRREIKFVAGSLQLMPDRIGTASPARSTPPARRKGRTPPPAKASVQERTPPRRRR